MQHTFIEKRLEKSVETFCGTTLWSNVFHRFCTSTFTCVDYYAEFELCVHVDYNKGLAAAG